MTSMGCEHFLSNQSMQCLFDTLQCDAFFDAIASPSTYPCQWVNEYGLGYYIKQGFDNSMAWCKSKIKHSDAWRILLKLCKSNYCNDYFHVHQISFQIGDIWGCLRNQKIIQFFTELMGPLNLLNLRLLTCDL